MADQGENREEAQRTTESRSTEGLDLNSELTESYDDDQSDHRHEAESRSSEKKGLDMNLKPSESSTDHRHQTESRSSENEVEKGEICDQKDSDAEIQRPRDVEMQRRSHETESRALPLKKRGKAVDCGERESQRVYVDIANRRHETDRRSRTNRMDTFSDWKPSESDCPYYLRTGRCGFGKACHFNHPTRLPSVCKFCQRGFCNNGSYCKFVHPEDRNWRYDERRGSRTMPETRGITISEPRRGAQENEQEQRMRERTTPDSRDRDSRERSDDRSGENRVNGVSDSRLNGNGIQNASVPEVDGPDFNLKPSIDVDRSNQSVQPSHLVPNNNEEPMKDKGADEEFSEGSFDSWASETDPVFDEELDEYMSRSYVPPVVEDMDPEFLAALPPEIRQEVLAQQRIVRREQVDTDCATSGLLALQTLQPWTYIPPAVEDMNPEFLGCFSPEVREDILRGGPVDPGFMQKLPGLLSEDDSYTTVDRSDGYTSGLLASQKLQPRNYEPPAVKDIDPEFLAALPPEMRKEVLGQQRIVQGEPAVTDYASANTIDPGYLQELPTHLREEILLNCSEENLKALPPHLFAEARMLRDRAMAHQLHQQEQRQQQNIERQRRDAQENVQEQRESVEKLCLKAKSSLDSKDRNRLDDIISWLTEEIVAGFKLARMIKAIPDSRGFAGFGEISHIIDEIVARFKLERSVEILESMAQENPSEQSVEDQKLEEMLDQYKPDKRNRER